MPIIYDVTIKHTDKGNCFHITWHNAKTNAVNSFDQAAEITPEETQRMWQWPQCQLDIGQKLFRFLDGNACCLQHALNKAKQQNESLQLYLHACKQIIDWPFELLAHGDKFLLPHELHLVRRVSDWGAKRDIPPQNRQLKLLFMACSALDVKPVLDFEKEEEAIFHINEGLPIDMDVEDSGSLEGLRSQLKQKKHDVIHLSGHTNIDENGRPYFIMEDETGYAHRVFPDELWNEALINNPPRLLFLSGCRTGEAPDRGAAVSFTRILVEMHNIPAVLGWGRPVADDQAIHAEKVLYHELSRGKTILDAIQRVRYELIKKFQAGTDPAWPLLRLFSSGVSLNAILEEEQQWQLNPRRIQHTYLRNSQVQVLSEGFVGRRRQLQISLRILKQDFEKVGVLLLGTGGLGKSCLAGKICERFKDYTLIIVHGKLNSITLEAALKNAFILAQDENAQKILEVKKELTEKLANLCATSFREKNYLMLLDDFEQNLEGVDNGESGALVLEAVDLMKALLYWLPYCGQKTQLIITSRYEFSLTQQAQDLVEERLGKVWLTSFQETEQRKKAHVLKNIMNYPNEELALQLLSAGHGNPRLMEWLDVLVGQMRRVEVQELLKAIKNKQEVFIHDHVICKLLQRGGKKLELFLRWLSIYRRSVLEEGAVQLAEKARVENWKRLLKKGISLSLVEYDQVRQTYQVTPLLREELVIGLKDIKQVQEVAFTYYKKVCETKDSFDPVLTEEWIFHALGCGEEEVASRQGGKLVNHLRNRLALRESRRVGEWILNEKKRYSTECDADLLNAFGSTLHVLGDYPKAIERFEQALSILKKTYGEMHPGAAICLNKMGLAWSELGDHEKARGYIKQALGIFKEYYEEEHPDVAGTLNNLGLVLQALGHPLKAIDCFNQALFIDRSLYGEAHPSVARDLNKIGSARQVQGHYQEATGYFKQALTICKQVYGEKHPDVAICLNNLGSVWRDKDDHTKAIDYIEEALDILMEYYEGRHPDIAETLNKLGLEWQTLGHPLKAIERFEQALFIDRSVYGEMHPTVSIRLSNLGVAYFDLGKRKKAKGYFEKADEILVESFGPEHPKTKEINEWLKKC